MDYIREDDFKIKLGSKQDGKKKSIPSNRFESEKERRAMDRLKAAKVSSKISNKIILLLDKSNKSYEYGFKNRRNKRTGV